MQETRKRFHDELDALESEILGLGERAELAISRAVTGLVRKDRRLTKQVIDEDDAIDATYMDVERRILGLLATQTPVASDLRLRLAEAGARRPKPRVPNARGGGRVHSRSPLVPLACLMAAPTAEAIVRVAARAAKKK